MIWLGKLTRGSYEPGPAGPAAIAAGPEYAPYGPVRRKNTLDLSVPCG